MLINRESEMDKEYQNKKARRFYKKNRVKIQEQRQHKKKFNDFMAEVADENTRHDALFLATYYMKCKPAQSNGIVAQAYQKLIDDLQLDEQRGNAVNKPAFYKALTNRLEAL